MRTFANWEDVPIFDSEDSEADFWQENRPDLRLMEAARSDSAEASESVTITLHFVEYWEAGSLAIREAVLAMPVEGESAAKLELAVMYAMPRQLIWTRAARATCMGGGERSEAVRKTCAQLGAAMRERGSTWMTRLVGARMIEVNVGTPELKAMAGKSLAQVRAQVAACAFATSPMLDGLESADAATRAKAIAAWDQWLAQEALVGEARACEIRVAAGSGK